MKILIVSYLFAPINEIGAIRPTKFAKYLIKKGMTVDVISYGSKENNTLKIPDGIRNHYMMSKTPVKREKYNKVSNKKNKVFNSLIFELKKTYRFLLDLKKTKQFLKYAFNEYKRNKNVYDVLITSYGPLSSIFCGLKIKKFNPNIKWVCDFRDPIVTEDSPKIFKPYLKMLQNKACKKADSIIAVSQGYLNRICNKKTLHKSCVITNGFDISDLEGITNNNNNSKKLIFSYAGSLYEGKRNLRPLFSSLSYLIKEKKLEKAKIKFQYAGLDFEFLKEQATEFELQDILVDNGCMSRHDCLQMQADSNILVLSTWNRKNEQGVLPGKFIEYLLFNRPILSIVDGNKEKSEITEIIENGKLGFSFEIAHHKQQFENLIAFLYTNYCIIMNNQSNEFAPNNTVVEAFNYDNLIEKILKIVLCD